MNLLKSLFKQLCGIIILVLGLFCSQAFAQLTLKSNITGIQDKEVLQNAKERLKIAQYDPKIQLTPSIINILSEKGSKEIRKAAEPFGYFKSTVKSTLIQRHNTWTTTYYVNLGTPLRITTLDVRIIGSGSKNKAMQKLLTKLPIKKGDIFNVKSYKKTENDLLSLAQKQGYLHANLHKDRIVIHLRPYTCSIKLIIDTGSRFYFGSVTFSKIPLCETFLKRYILFQPHHPFSYQALTDLQRDLNGSGYFQYVSVIPDIPKSKISPKKQIPVKVNLRMRKQKKYQFGFGYGTNTGIRGLFGFGLNWANRYGHKFNTWIKLSSLEQDLALQYIIPAEKPAHENYALTAGIFRQTPDEEEESVTKSIGIDQVKNYKFWQRTISLDYQIDDYRLTDNSPDIRSHLLVPSINFSHVNANKFIGAQNGRRFSISLQGASKSVFSSVSFIQTELQYKRIYSPNENNKFIFRGNFGDTWIEDPNKLPLSKRFYTGGIDTVRGYGLKSLGPGSKLIIGSIEYQRRIIYDLYAAIFYDIGNASNHFSDLLKKGTGVGVVWQTPIGALELYASTALSDKDKPWSFEFSFGPDL